MDDKPTRSVLVVEDNDDFRRVLAQFLSFYGFSPVLDAPDGLAAWELFQRQRVDLLVTDINMPKMSGIELMEKVREQDRLVPIIVITGYAQELHHLSPFEVQAVLVKPFKMPALNAEIRRIFEQGPA